MFARLDVRTYFALAWLTTTALCLMQVVGLPAPGLRDQIHLVLLVTTYGAIYLLPALVTWWLLSRVRPLAGVAVAVAIVMTAVTQLLVFADGRLYDLYGFHLNGFVWNLITTPGGLESLQGDQSHLGSLLGYGLLFFAAQGVALFTGLRWPWPLRSNWPWMVVLLLATLAERGIYGYSEATLYGPVMDRAEALALYQPLTMHSALRRLGVPVERHHTVRVKADSGKLRYPLAPLQLEPVATPPNLVFLVAESLRWDMLNPQVMPQASAFARTAWRFDHHYSSGNGTRQGLFGLFYGLYGTYWDSFLRARQRPLLLDVLDRYGYQYFLYTGARFTYPELDQTVFAGIDKALLLESTIREPWQRDADNTTRLIAAIANRNRGKPFMAFQFFEGTHARYSFAPEDAIRKDYLESIDYVGLTRKQLAPRIAGMKARYENAAHGVDRQIGRLLASLRASGELDHTVVVITGDHGEEFMERGRWGHNSGFTDWQVRVPMVIHWPGGGARHIERPTSHLDLVPTLLPRLGVRNAVADYSLGWPLDGDRRRRPVVVSSWNDVGIISDQGKLVVPFGNRTQHRNLATDLQDQPIPAARLIAADSAMLGQVLKAARLFAH